MEKKEFIYTKAELLKVPVLAEIFSSITKTLEKFDAQQVEFNKLLDDHHAKLNLAEPRSQTIIAILQLQIKTHLAMVKVLKTQVHSLKELNDVTESGLPKYIQLAQKMLGVFNKVEGRIDDMAAKLRREYTI